MKHNFEFRPFHANRSKHRIGETHLNEVVHDAHTIHEAQFVILGISEDVGPRMNKGNGGAHQGFSSFVSKLLSTQSNTFFKGTELGILGELVFDTYPEEASSNLVEQIDQVVFDVLQKHVCEKQQLIVIGGGHNNALPLLRFEQFRSKRPASAINIDPHADFRSTEERHSGNPFSFAFQEGAINEYAVFGLHEAYNNVTILDGLKESSSRFWTFEQHLDKPKATLEHFYEYVESIPTNKPTTLDIDLDAIAFAPTSAFTPSGFSIEDIRMMIRRLAKNRKFNIFHLPEGAPKTEEEALWMGKMLAYFVLDFVKCQLQK